MKRKIEAWNGHNKGSNNHRHVLIRYEGQVSCSNAWEELTQKPVFGAARNLAAQYEIRSLYNLR